LSAFLSNVPPRLVLVEGALARVIIDPLLGAVGHEVVRVTAVEASFLLSTMATTLMVVVELLEPVDHQC
jgi:hypothetical protein